MSDIREDRIRLRAYRIWQEKSRPRESAESAQEDWLQAETEIEAEDAAEAEPRQLPTEPSSPEFPGSKT